MPDEPCCYNGDSCHMRNWLTGKWYGSPQPIKAGAEWQTTCLGAPVSGGPVTCIKALVCLPCATVDHRKRVLPLWPDQYRCCGPYRAHCLQGCGNCCICCDSGCSCCETSCPTVGLFLEAVLCPFIAVSANHLYIQDKFELEDAECDQCMIKASNCLLCFMCCADVAKIIHLCVGGCDHRSGDECFLGFLFMCLGSVRCGMLCCTTAQHERELQHHEQPTAASAVDTV